jgi:hypothetical protein
MIQTVAFAVLRGLKEKVTKKVKKIRQRPQDIFASVMKGLHLSGFKSRFFVR